MTIYQMNILPLPAHACLVCHRVWLVTVAMVDVVWSISTPVVMLWSDYWTLMIRLPEVFPRHSLMKPNHYTSGSLTSIRSLYYDC